MSTLAGAPTEDNWKENLFFIYDASVNKKEEDPPEDAILVFLAPVDVELRTQVGHMEVPTRNDDSISTQKCISSVHVAVAC